MVVTNHHKCNFLFVSSCHNPHLFFELEVMVLLEIEQVENSHISAVSNKHESLQGHEVSIELEVGGDLSILNLVHVVAHSLDLLVVLSFDLRFTSVFDLENFASSLQRHEFTPMSVDFVNALLDFFVILRHLSKANVVL